MCRRCGASLGKLPIFQGLAPLAIDRRRSAAKTITPGPLETQVQRHCARPASQFAGRELREDRFHFAKRG